MCVFVYIWGYVGAGACVVVCGEGVACAYAIYSDDPVCVCVCVCVCVYVCVCSMAPLQSTHT